MTSTKNILILTYWSFSDALVQTYTLPYVKIMADQLPPGSRIHLLTLERSAPVQQHVTGYDTIVHLPLNYLPFGVSAVFGWMKNLRLLRRYIRKQQIDYIHAFCTPAGMVGYLLARMSLKPLVLDSFEPHAEAMVENGEWKKSSSAFKILFYFEKKQSQQASYVIAAAHGMDAYAKEKYGVALPGMLIKPACVDLEAFTLSYRKDKTLLAELELKDKIVCVYAGKFGGIYLKSEVFEFYKACYALWGDRFAALILTSHLPAEIEAMAQAAGLPKHLFRVRFVPHADMPRHMGLGDFAITPVKPVPTKNFCTPIKNGEYWAMGLPVVITQHISVDSALIKEHDAGYVLEELHAAEYTRAAEKISVLLAEKDLALKIRSMAERYRNYAIAHSIYARVYAA